MKRNLLAMLALTLAIPSLPLWAAPGDLDAGFGSGGKVTTAVGTGQDRGNALIQQMDGKLVIAGYSNSAINGTNFVLLRYNSNGSLDTTFNGSGKLVTDKSGNDEAYTVIQQADGKLVAAGMMLNDDFGIARYNLDGSLDASFSGDGIQTTNLSAGTDRGRSVIQQFDGKLVLAGNSLGDFALVRYNSDGSLDTSFDGDGKLFTDNGFADVALSIIQQTDGKLVVAGYSSVNSTGSYYFSAARYNQNGSLDNTFGDDGKQLISLGDADAAGNFQAFGQSLIQQYDGKLLIAGYATVGGGPNFALVRLNSNGTLDSTFSNDGILTTAIGSGKDYAFSVIQQADGKLVVAGSGLVGGYDGDSFMVARYTLDGSLDTSFNGNGQKIVSFSAFYDVCNAVVQQKDGKLVLGGFRNTANPINEDFAIARLESGQSDTDADGLVDWLDTDNDADGVLNIEDAFPLDPAESLDTDHDGVGNNADTDDDNDGVPDYIDADPLSAAINMEKTLLLNGVYKGSLVQESVAE